MYSALLTCHNFFEGASNHEGQGRGFSNDCKLCPDHEKCNGSSKKNDQAGHKKVAWGGKVSRLWQSNPELLSGQRADTSCEGHHCSTHHQISHFMWITSQDVPGITSEH